MEQRTGCLICGEALIYAERRVPRRCFYCGVAENTTVACAKSHYVCDRCCITRNLLARKDMASRWGLRRIDEIGRMGKAYHSGSGASTPRYSNTGG